MLIHDKRGWRLSITVGLTKYSQVSLRGVSAAFAVKTKSSDKRIKMPDLGFISYKV